MGPPMSMTFQICSHRLVNLFCMGGVKGRMEIRMGEELGSSDQ